MDHLLTVRLSCLSPPGSAWPFASSLVPSGARGAAFAVGCGFTAGLIRRQTYAGQTRWRHSYWPLAWCMAFWTTSFGEGGACFGRVQTVTMISFISCRPPLGGEPDQPILRAAAHPVDGEVERVARLSVDPFTVTCRPPRPNGRSKGWRQLKRSIATNSYR